MELTSRQTQLGPISIMTQRLRASRRDRRASMQFAAAEANLLAAGLSFEPSNPTFGSSSTPSMAEVAA